MSKKLNRWSIELKILLQIRGANASGKSTAVRQWINRREHEVISIKAKGKLIECVAATDGSWIVVGTYPEGRATGGVDGKITDVEILKELLTVLMKRHKPKAIIFEGMVYGKTFKLGWELNAIAKRLGYHYRALVLSAPLSVNLERVWNRNGGKDINEKALAATKRSCETSYLKLKEAGIDIRKIETGNMPYESMYRIIEENL